MTDLSQHEEIKDLTFDHNGAHLAICHKMQGGSANGEHEALLLKGALPVSQEVIKSLEGVYDKEKINKMSNRNLRNMLESALENAYRAASPYTDYVYVWVNDFDENTVVYSYQDTKYAVMFEQGEDGIELKGDIKEAVEHTIYLSTNGKELLLKHAGVAQDPEVASATEDNQGEEVTKSDNQAEPLKTEGIEMSDAIVKSDAEIAELINKAVLAATADQAEAIVKAQADARAELKAEMAQVELEKASKEIVKGFEFISEEIQVDVIKAVMSQEDGGVAIVKALELAQAAIVKANEEKDAIKKEFGEAKHSEESGEVIEKSVAERLAEKIKLAKAAKAST